MVLRQFIFIGLRLSVADNHIAQHCACEGGKYLTNIWPTFETTTSGVIYTKQRELSAIFFTWTFS